MKGFKYFNRRRKVFELRKKIYTVTKEKTGW